MKKNLLKMAAFASMMAFVACSNEDDFLPENGSVDLEGEVIEIALSNTGEGMSRAARPIGSSAASNNVNKIQLSFYSKAVGVAGEYAADPAVKVAEVLSVNDEPNPSTTVKGTNLIDVQGVTVSEILNAKNPNISTTVKVKLSGLKENTSYKIVAYGYNGETFAYGTPEDKLGEFTTTKTLTDYNIEEVFAGVVERQTKEMTPKFVSAPVVTMTRQIAGILTYLRVPAFVNGKKVAMIQVVANNKSEAFKFPFAGPLNGNANKNIEDILMTFDMSKAAANYKSVSTDNMDAYYTNGMSAESDLVSNLGGKGVADGYKAPAGMKIVKDAFIGARYIIPYAEHCKSQTLNIRILGEGNSILKVVKVVTNADKPGDFTETETDKWKYNYDIRRNNFYSIGKKLQTDEIVGPDGPDPDPDPDTDPDTPIDLGATDQIIVEINDAWDVLHDMGIEE